MIMNPSKRIHAFIGGTILLCYFPLSSFMPLWVGLLLGVIISSRLVLDLMEKGPFSSLVANLLAVSIFAMVLIQFGPTIERVSGSALLALMTGLKFLESRGKREDGLCISLCLVLLGASSFFRTHVFWAGYILLAATLVTGVASYSLESSSGVKDAMNTSLRAAIAGIPLALLLFLTFPRIPGGIWGIGSSGAVSVTGLSRVLDPGSVAALALSRDIVFRAWILSPRCASGPPFYWRVYTMEEFDGARWIKSKGERNASCERPIIAIKDRESLCKYRIRLEPRTLRGYPALDWPAFVDSPSLRIGQDLTLKNTKKKRKQSLRYKVRSKGTPFYTEIMDKKEFRQKYLSLPKGQNPLTRALVKHLLSRGTKPKDFIKKVFRFFKQNRFSYTLTPPPIAGDNPVDTFLFKTRKGFCGHYAYSLAYMLRLAGIPSRVVTGFLGGEENPIGSYYIIRNSSAHAWVEAFFEKRWWRVDPTAAVSPQRISAQDALYLIGSGALHVIYVPGWTGIKGVFHLFNLGVDAMNQYWSRWVVGFNELKQFQLAKRLGFKRPRIWGVPVILAIGVLTLMPVLTLYLLLGQKEQMATDHRIVSHLYHMFLLGLKKEGVTKRPWEGPKALLDRLKKDYPNLADKAEQFLGLYMEAAYGRDLNPADISKLREALKGFLKAAGLQD